MAKLKAPLLSMGASGQIGKAVVYFPWKGLNVARKHVVPSNPQSDAQMTQRGFLGAAVDRVHYAMQESVGKLASIDKSAYALWASAQGMIMTWFNTAIKDVVEQYVDGKLGEVYRGATLVPAAGQVTITVYSNGITAGGATAGDFVYGTSKTALLSSIAATIDTVNHTASKAISGLTDGTTYYFQFRPSATPNYVGNDSGIYHATPG